MLSVKKDVKNSWEKLETYLKRRFDLVKELVELTSDIIPHDLYKDITNVINNYSQTNKQTEIIKLNQQISDILFQMIPMLNEKKSSLHEKLFDDIVCNLIYKVTKTENTILQSIKTYNKNIKKYNSILCVFPNNIVSSLYGLNVYKYFVYDRNKLALYISADCNH
jgi:hypothetical protein